MSKFRNSTLYSLPSKSNIVVSWKKKHEKQTNKQNKQSCGGHTRSQTKQTVVLILFLNKFQFLLHISCTIYIHPHACTIQPVCIQVFELGLFLCIVHVGGYSKPHRFFVFGGWRAIVRRRPTNSLSIAIRGCYRIFANNSKTWVMSYKIVYNVAFLHLWA